MGEPRFIRKVVTFSKPAQVDLDGNDQARSFFCCHNKKSCQYCEIQIAQAEKFTSKVARQMKYFTQTSGQRYNFMSLVQELIPNPKHPNERMIKGCQILVPETVFYDEGRIEFMTASDRENCIALDVKTKLVNQDVLKKLKELVYERRKDTQLFGKLKCKEALSHRRFPGKPSQSENYMFRIAPRFQNGRCQERSDSDREVSR